MLSKVKAPGFQYNCSYEGVFFTQLGIRDRATPHCTRRDTHSGLSVKQAGHH